MEEIRIDCLNRTERELAAAKELRQDIFRLNHTMPDTEEYDELLRKVFPNLGANCRIETPFSGVRTANVKFGRNVIVMPGFTDDVGGRYYHRRRCDDCRRRPAYLE